MVNMPIHNDDFCKSDGRDLKELLSAQIANLHTLIDANDKNYNQRFENVITATQAALAAADRAVNKAETASEKRFDAVNEFRSTLADQQRTLMPRNEVDILIKGLSERIESLSTLLVSYQGEKTGIRESLGWVFGIIGVTATVTTIISRFIK